MDNASPFNTNDEIQMPLFTKKQVFDLMEQYETETGQKFAKEVKGEVKEYIRLANPIYQKKLYNYFRPDFRSEDALYFKPDEDLEAYISGDELNLLEIIKNYQRYINRRGKKAFAHGLTRKDGRKFDAVYHYSFDAYLSSFLDSVGGSSGVEFPTGNGKVDIFVLYKKIAA